MRYGFLAAVAAFVLGLGPALAGGTYEVFLEDGKISHTEINAKVGDVIAIHHKDDEGVHALYSDAEGHSFDLSTMKDGDHYDLVLKSSGTIEIRCDVMPGMTLTVNVSE